MCTYAQRATSLQTAQHPDPALMCWAQSPSHLHAPVLVRPVILLAMNVMVGQG